MDNPIIIETIEHTGSTNSDLLTRAKQGAPEGLWLRAISQGQGRGRNLRDWVSPIGNVYTSTIIRLRVDDPPATTLAFVAALALYDSINHYLKIDDVMIKWPNDILVGTAKICGILLERSDDAVIMGTGVNLVNSPKNIDRKAVSIAELGVDAPDADDFMKTLTGNFARWLAIWRNKGFSYIREHWMQNAHPLGQKVTYKEYDTDINGLFAGLDDDGACLLRLEDGAIYTIHAGDIFILE